MQTSQNRRESMPNIPEPSDFLNSCPSYILRNPWFIFDIIISFTRLGYGLRDGSGVGYQYECWKSSKRGGVIFNPKVYIADVGPLNWSFSRFPFGKKFQYSFPKMRGGVVKGHFDLFKNSYVLVARGAFFA